MATQAEAAELKQQGAIEAAQDPNSKVTAEDAEKKILDEAKKAGSAAFEFDPDASPEEKRAQARAHIPPGLKHERKPNAAVLVSDAVSISHLRNACDDACLQSPHRTALSAPSMISLHLQKREPYNHPPLRPPPRKTASFRSSTRTPAGKELVGLHDSVCRAQTKNKMRVHC